LPTVKPSLYRCNTWLGYCQDLSKGASIWFAGSSWHVYEMCVMPERCKQNDWKEALVYDGCSKVTMLVNSSSRGRRLDVYDSERKMVASNYLHLVRLATVDFWQESWATSRPPVAATGFARADRSQGSTRGWSRVTFSDWNVGLC
jgi:hypothetical protein